MYIPREGRVTIASIGGDRAGAKSRRHAAAEIHMQREPDSHVPVDQLCPVTLGPLLPLTIRSLSCTEAGSTGWLKFTS